MKYHTLCNGTFEECETCPMADENGDCLAQDNTTEKDLTQIFKEGE